MFPSRGHAKTRRDDQAVPQRDNRVHDAVPSQRLNPKPLGAPVVAPFVDQSRQLYSPYTQCKSNYAGPPPSYRTNPSVATFKTPRHESHTAYPTPQDNPKYATPLKIDEAGRAAPMFNDVASQPPQRMEPTSPAQRISRTHLEDLDSPHSPTSPNSPRRRALPGHGQAACPSPTSFSPGQIPETDPARLHATGSIVALPCYALMAPSDSNLTTQERSDGAVSADLDTVRRAATDLWKRKVICSRCNRMAVYGGNHMFKFSLKDVDLRATHASCPSFDAILIRCCGNCGTYCRGCHKRPQCLSPQNCKRRCSVASYEIMASLEEEILQSGGVSKFLNRSRTWETLHKALKVLTFYYECGSEDNSQWNCDNLLRLSLLPRVIRSVLKYHQLSNWLGSQHKPDLYTAIFDFLAVLLLRQEDRELFTERWFCIKDNSGGLRNWMEHGGTIEFERGEDGRAITMPSFQELLRELRNGLWWKELTNYARKTCPDRVGASYARDWLVKVQNMLK
ncbi:uncharacterized protein BT62DRAFT_918613 [Guyanagaster necrorhizus]|uniref:Uncharacterized protein n=1 Tax=Guyanagaster necrorhizus TaxID=856835 RepID=A0A9P7VYJ2_9AGAR|nr:uncharacterized protein BT62DRAFT_918613 [Guyanagaster necrorhizus MCA 3950]KAG7448181.1 hypothetical protein BT62DRAFT_918613 [Guyanagaster necrorhizus MCA 3950]